VSYWSVLLISINRRYVIRYVVLAVYYGIQVRTLDLLCLRVTELLFIINRVSSLPYRTATYIHIPVQSASLPVSKTNRTMSIETIPIDTQAIDTTEPLLSLSQPLSTMDGEGGIEIMPPIPPTATQEANNDSMNVATATPRTNTGDRITPSQSNQHAGRTRNNERGTGGRTPVSGRGLVMGGGRTGRNNSYGRGRYNNNQQRTTIQVHSNSGVPFGHVPAYLPGASSLVEELDQRVLLVLRDGKHIIGVSCFFLYFRLLLCRRYF
jgi:hypothetical protein